MMELHQLKTFVTIADEGHLTRAANRLHTSQPAVSAHIKSLEEELGVVLFERTPKGMRLTASGEKLLLKAQAVLQATAEMHYIADHLKTNLSGSARLGLHIDPKYLRVAELLQAMRATAPDVELHYLQKMTWEAADALRKGQLDVAFAYGDPDGEDIGGLLLKSFNLVIVGPLAWKDRLKNAKMDQLVKMPWISTHESCPFYKVAGEIFDRPEFMLSKAVVADQETVIRELVTAGAGLSLMMEAEAMEAANDGLLYIATDAVACLNLYIWYFKKRGQDPLVQTLLSVISEVWDKKSPP